MSKCYIYGHKCTITNKWYIGQTAQTPSKRFGSNGRNYINNNQPKFENAIKKYSWDNFDHVILEECDIENANSRETYWITVKDSYLNGYNSTPGGDKLSEGCKKRVVKINPITSEVIKIYDSAVEAAEDNNLYNGACISACCNGKLLTSAGFCWCYEDNLEKFKVYLSTKKRIYTHKIAKIDPTTKNIVDIYDSPTEAGISNNIKNMTNNIHRISKNENAKIGGWNWKFLDEKIVRFV